MQIDFVTNKNIQMNEKLTKEFYISEDVEQIARDLLGKFLVTHFNNQYTCGMIVETEAYAGIADKASHAYSGRRTKRTETMYAEGGTAYVYLIYGIYSLFNVVTSKAGIPHAILIRALEPVDGIDIMLSRRKMTKIKHNLSGGPGLLTQALGISTQHMGYSLLGKKIWIEDRTVTIAKQDNIASPRVGVAYAQEDADLPFRFRIKDNPWCSKAK